MFNTTTFFLWALAACFLWLGSLAEDLQSQYVCLLDDPDPNQCDSFCLKELRPLLKQVIKGQGRGFTCDADQETKAKLDRLVGQEARLRSQFQGVEAKMEGQLQDVKAKLDGVEAKLEGQKTVLTRMADSLAKLEGKLPAVQTSRESKPQATLSKSKNQNPLQEVSTTTEANVNIPSGFEIFGTRYFKIVYEGVNWITAEKRCREMGGYLAAFRNEEDIKAITVKLHQHWTYWLGLNDREIEGRFVSVASHKPAGFLKWEDGQPNNKNNNQNCVALLEGKMWDERCNKTRYFICQADNET
ncbi:hypothetical protein KR054_011288 [Drosophila jambulina]|nr:hypothetical protein KR054_011288 [Drosophila jambulina]